jgi:tyrosyl-tRNA synthetase
MSFTEFTYQLVQGYDFFYLYEHKNCKIQLGGSDQWGNITTGTELIRRKRSGEAYAVTCPLITKADGGKFGKTESGNIWLDPAKTSPYKFYQFWLNCSDDDSVRYIKIFTMFDQNTVENLIAEHQRAPHFRLLQKTLAKDITTRVHGEAEYNKAIEAAEALFSKDMDGLKNLDESSFLDVFDGVEQYTVAKNEFLSMDIVSFLGEKTAVYPSKGEARRALKDNSVSVNKLKVKDDYKISENDLIKDKFVWVQKGRKNYFLVIIE